MQMDSTIVAAIITSVAAIITALITTRKANEKLSQSQPKQNKPLHHPCPRNEKTRYIYNSRKM